MINLTESLRACLCSGWGGSSNAWPCMPVHVCALHRQSVCLAQLRVHWVRSRPATSCLPLSCIQLLLVLPVMLQATAPPSTTIRPVHQAPGSSKHTMRRIAPKWRVAGPCVCLTMAWPLHDRCMTVKHSFRHASISESSISLISPRT